MPTAPAAWENRGDSLRLTWSHARILTAQYAMQGLAHYGASHGVRV